MRQILSVLLLLAPAPGLWAVLVPSPATPESGVEFMPPEAVSPQQKITTFLWFDDDAEEAVRFYTSIFEDAKVLAVTRWGEGGHAPKGSVLTIEFQLAGQRYIAMNGGPQFHFNEAISLLVSCETQAEIDTYWEKLLAGGGQTSACGWLKDKYGLSWQVVPEGWEALFTDPDPERANRAMQAMLGMQKLDIAALEAAADGATV
jgi:predicted 3-demethylubiquinone-9 3-methyltransferase (glyoxalase superfamily)